MGEKTDIKQDDYFGTKTDVEVLRNVAKAVSAAVNSVVDLVGKTISKFKPKGAFMQTASNQWEKSPKDS